MKKLFSVLITLSLIFGVSVAIYQSHIEQVLIKNENQSPVVKNIEISKKNIIPYSAPEVVNKIQTETSSKKIEIKPIPGFFEGKLSDNTTLHVIGVYEGDKKDGTDSSPWWSKCQDSSGRIDTSKALECHRKYAGKHEQKTVNISISYNESPIVIALMAYEPTMWNLNIKENVKIEGIILAGYHGQEISGITDDARIITYTHKTSGCESCIRGEGYFYTYKQDEKYQKAITRLVEITGVQPSSFQGTYRSGSFSISNNID